jgi:hypothetical protein
VSTVSTPDFLPTLLLERMGMRSDGEAVHTRDTCTRFVPYALMTRITIPQQDLRYDPDRHAKAKPVGLTVYLW